jgi:hypothetical protein
MTQFALYSTLRTVYQGGNWSVTSAMWSEILNIVQESLELIFYVNREQIYLSTTKLKNYTQSNAYCDI